MTTGRTGAPTTHRTNAPGPRVPTQRPSGRGVGIGLVALALLLASPAAVRAGDEAATGLVVRVRTADGRDVPRAIASMTGRAGTQTTEFRHARVEQGHATLRRFPFASGTPAEVTEVTVDVYAATDADGVPLPWGPAQVRRAGPPTGTIEVTLPPERVLTGRLTTPDGRPVRDAVLLAMPAENPYSTGVPSRLGLAVHAEAATDADGRFRLGRLDDRPYAVWIVDATTRSPRSVEPRTARGGDPAVAWVLELTRTVILKVVDPTGAPVLGAYVQLRRAGRRGPPEAYRPADGEVHVRLEGLDPTATYGLELRGPYEREDVGALRIDAWSPADGTLTLPAAWTLRGQVVDADGNPTRAEVWITEAAGRTSLPTEPDGTFEARGLGKAAVRVVARRLPSEAAAAPDARPAPDPGMRVEPTDDLVEVRLPR